MNINNFSFFTCCFIFFTVSCKKSDGDSSSGTNQANSAANIAADFKNAKCDVPKYMIINRVAQNLYMCDVINDRYKLNKIDSIITKEKNKQLYIVLKTTNNILTTFYIDKSDNTFEVTIFGQLLKQDNEYYFIEGFKSGNTSFIQGISNGESFLPGKVVNNEFIPGLNISTKMKDQSNQDSISTTFVPGIFLDNRKFYPGIYVDNNKFFAGFIYYAKETGKTLYFIPGVVSFENNQYKVVKNISLKNETFQYSAEDKWYNKTNYPFTKEKLLETSSKNTDYFYTTEQLINSEVGIPIDKLSKNELNINLSFNMLNAIRLTQQQLEPLKYDSLWTVFSDRYNPDSLVDSAKDYWATCTVKSSDSTKSSDILKNNFCNVMGALATSVDSEHKLNTAVSLFSLVTLGYGVPAFALFNKYNDLYEFLLNTAGLLIGYRINLRLNNLLTYGFDKNKYKLFKPLSMQDSMLLAAVTPMKAFNRYSDFFPVNLTKTQEMLQKYYSKSSKINDSNIELRNSNEKLGGMLGDFFYGLFITN